MLFKAIEKMKISIVGTGMIATEVITLLKTEVKGIDITSIYSHSNEEKAEYLAKMNHIERIYTDYAQLLKEDKANFVYIALVNNAHYEFTRMALEAGRNVIVEKPSPSLLPKLKNYPQWHEKESYISLKQSPHFIHLISVWSRKA